MFNDDFLQHKEHQIFYCLLCILIPDHVLLSWVNGTRIKLQLWDTAGQERFRSLAPMYYRGAAAALLVYDVTSEESFQKVKEWVKELRTNIYEDIILAIVGNQVDRTYRQVERAEAEEYAHSIGALCFETSAKTNKGIEEMFVEMAKQLVDLRAPTQPVDDNNNSTKPKEGCGCSIS